MRRAVIYGCLQLKRALRLLPAILAVTVLLAALAVLAGVLLSRMSESDEARQRVRLGVVGSADAGGLAQGISLLESMDNSRFSLSLEALSEQEARRALEARELDAYLLVPDGFVSAMAQGEHRPITFVSRDSGAGVGGILVRELARDISALVLETENAIYGTQDYTAAHLPGQNPYEAGDRLVMQYMARILDRHRLFQLETVGLGNHLSMAGYYLCGLAVLFVMLWAIGCSPLFTARSRELSRLLYAEGLGAARQILAEMVSFSALLLCGVLCAGAVGAALFSRAGPGIPELAGADAAGLLRRSLSALPAALMLSAMSFFLYELTNRTVGGILVLFFSAVVQGYLAGCFYPASFFPDGLRAIGLLLPAGVAMGTLQGLLRSGNGTPWPVWGYFLLFLGLSVLVRHRRLWGEGEAVA